jgi:predicted GNAT family acetyltransferase
MAPENISFANNEFNNQFTVQAEGRRGLIEYEKFTSDHVDMYHTEVDPELQGTGVAKILVQWALEYCRANNWKVTPSCTYVAAYIKRHPEWQDLVKDLA